MTVQNDAGYPVGDDHLRFARYQQDLAQVRKEDEQDLLAAVLRHRDQGMAQSVVAGHFDRPPACSLIHGSRAGRDVTQVVEEREFLTAACANGNC